MQVDLLVKVKVDPGDVFPRSAGGDMAAIMRKSARQAVLDALKRAEDMGFSYDDTYVESIGVVGCDIYHPQRSEEGCLPCTVPTDPAQSLAITCAYCGACIDFREGEVFVNGPSYVCEKHKEIRMKIEVELKPWRVPSYVIPKRVARPRQEGFQEGMKLHISEVDAEALAELCDRFRADVFAKAGKTDPAIADQDAQSEGTE